MAATVNDRDVLIMSQTRTVPVTIPADYTFNGNVTGTLNGAPVQDVVDKAYSATANYFTTSASDPVGGNDGDAHWNSTSYTMWFKTGGVWRVGGTINANQITVGTLAAARIAANSITADKISVSSLDVISPNLGSITSGNVTGAATIDGTPTSGVKNSNITLSATGALNGAGGGSITALDYVNVSGSKPPANATANYFTTSASNPAGGNDGDAHWNSTSSTMWFKTGGVWRVGGTINAGEITAGTLAAARIAAASITSDKLSVTSLSAINANLGTVTAGNISGSANINISGYGRFNGNDLGYLSSIVANASLDAAYGLMAYGGNMEGGVGVYGKSSAVAGSALRGEAQSASAVGVRAQNIYGGTALHITGPIFKIGTEVSNLNVEKWNGASNNGITTGGGTATFVDNNKPGGSTSNTWLSITMSNGSTYYIPAWL